MPNKSGIVKLLGALARIVPGDGLRTWVYLNLIAKPRRFVRSFTMTFYRMDVIYAVLNEAKREYQGSFSILEFGTADGYSFTKMLYATKYLGMANRVTVHAFDSFEGMPATTDRHDRDLVTGDGWVEGEYKGRYEKLKAYCDKKYHNHRIHKGLFADSLTDALVEELKTHKPILIWVDCDYYSSARSLMERLLPVIPNGSVIYFDDIYLNHGSRLTGEMRLVWEINQGAFGENIELVLDRTLSAQTVQVYRFMRLDAPILFEPVQTRYVQSNLRKRTNDSPLP